MKKKVKNSVLTFSAVLAAVMIFALALPFSASAETFSADIGTKTDILDMEIGNFKSRASGEFGMTEIQLTDGVIAADDTTRVFWNAKAVADRNASAVYEKEGGDYIYKLTDGTEKAYFYVVEFTDLRADVDSFAIYFNTDAKQDKAEDRYPSEYIDSSFDILVSSDGGKTFSVAWSSIRWPGLPSSKRAAAIRRRRRSRTAPARCSTPTGTSRPTSTKNTRRSTRLSTPAALSDGTHTKISRLTGGRAGCRNSTYTAKSCPKRPPLRPRRQK